jgi:hypothetical protein
MRSDRLAMVGLVLALSAGAEVPPARLPGLLPPEVHKGDWNQRGLLAAEIDGDGRTDLVFINNDKARVEILLQRSPGEAPPRRSGRVEGRDRWTPVLEDSRFESAPLTTATFMYDLAAGDLDGDGRTDLVISEKNNGLRLYFQSADGEWRDPVTVDLKGVVTYLGLLHLRDTAGNGRPEVIASTAKALHFYEWDGQLLRPVRKLDHSEENLHGLRFLDLDGDGRLDLQFCSTDRQYGLRVRRQEEPGRFGPELMIRQEPAEGILAPGRLGPDQPPFFAMLRKAGNLIELFRLEAPDGAVEGPRFSIEAFSAPVADRDKPVLTAWGDFDGNGRPDLAVSDHAGAQVHVYFQDAQGRLGSAQSFPSYSGITGLSAFDTDGDGRAELFLCSTGEEIVGVSALRPEGRLDFPHALPFPGVPTAVMAGPWGEGGASLVACAGRDGKQTLVRFLRRGAAGWETVATVHLAEGAADPERILPVDLDQNGRLDLVLAATAKPLVLLRQTNALAFAEVRDLSGHGKSLIARVAPGGLSTADVDGDGKPELVVNRKGFARALRLDARGQIEVVDQLNAGDPEVEVDAVFAVPRPGGTEFYLADAKRNRFEILGRDALGLLTPRDSLQLPSVRIKGGEVFTDPDGRSTLFLASDDKFWRVRLDHSTFTRRRLSVRETDLPEVVHGGIELGDLNHDGRPEVIVYDNTRTRVLEVFSIGDDYHLRPEFHFQVFEADPGARQAAATREPREVVVADFTGDGKQDLAVLVHDRVLMYAQP